jgi:hypothetical protein
VILAVDSKTLFQNTNKFPGMLQGVRVSKKTNEESG